MHYLDEVATEGSIRRAAERINVSPSAVNRQIINLEAQLGMPLFERLARGVKLTEAGKIVLRSIRRYNQDVILAMAQIDDLRGLRRGHVAIGTLLSFEEELVPSLLSRLRAEYPDISYFHFAGNSEDIVRQIVDGVLDVGLCFNPPASAPVARGNVIEVTQGILVPPDHPLANMQAVAFRDCIAYPFIFPARGSEIRRVLDRINVGIGGTVSPAIETNSIHVAKRLACAGAGIAVLPAFSANEEIREGKLVHRPLSDNGMQNIELALLYQKGRILPPVMQMVLSRLEESFVEYVNFFDNLVVKDRPS